MSRTNALMMSAFVFAAAVAGCGSHVDSGSISGDYRLVGGAYPGTARPMAGTVWAFDGQVSWEQASKSSPVAHATTDASGHFDLRLPAGVYTLLGSKDSSIDSLESSACGVPDVVHVEVTTSQTAHLICSIP